jgi:hypothetical protein
VESKTAAALASIDSSRCCGQAQIGNGWPGQAVWQKYSCSTAVAFEQPAEAFSAKDRSATATVALIVQGKQEEVALALVIAFVMVIHAELGQRPRQRALAEQNQLR